MSKTLIVTPEAEADLAEAYAWYQARRDGWGDRLILAVEATMNQIRRVPSGGRELQSGVRQLVTRQFPYAVIYRVDEDRISVLAVYHTSRNPQGWQDRE